MFCSYLRKCSNLSMLSHPSSASVRIRRFPYQIWVSRLRGLPVPPFPFPEKLRLCGTFKGLSHGINPLGFDTAVYPCGHPSLIDWTGTNTTVIADCASMDFPLTSGNASSCIHLYRSKQNSSGQIPLFQVLRLFLQESVPGYQVQP